jgi:hypothetical protein
VSLRSTAATNIVTIRTMSRRKQPGLLLSATRFGGFLDPRHRSIEVTYDGRLTYDAGRALQLDDDQLLELLMLLEALPPAVPSTIADDGPTLHVSHRVMDEERHFRVQLGLDDDPAARAVEALWSWLVAKLPADEPLESP